MTKQNPIQIVQVAVGPMQNFSYLIGDRKSGQALVVDPAWDIPKILEAAQENNLSIQGILVTHTHFDHINGVGDLLKKADVPVFVHEAEAGEIRVAVSSVKPVRGEDEVDCGDLNIKILHTPGHTPGSQCFLVQNQVVTGDTLFVKACGRSDLPGGDAEQLYQSLKRLGELSGKTIVHPGHDYGDRPTTSIELENKENPFLRFGSQGEFTKFVGG